MIGELILSALVGGAVAYPVAYFVSSKRRVSTKLLRVPQAFHKFKAQHLTADDLQGDRGPSIADVLDFAEKVGTRTSTESDYAVTGAPRHIPWHIRKREREAAARTKRKQLESFRDIEEGN